MVQAKKKAVKGAEIPVSALTGFAGGAGWFTAASRGAKDHYFSMSDPTSVCGRVQRPSGTRVTAKALTVPCARCVRRAGL